MRAFVLLCAASALACGGSSTPAPPATAPATSPSVETLPAAPSPPPPPANPDQAAVEAARPSLRACFDKARAANPALTRTTVKVSLRVNENGTVSFVDFEYTHKLDDSSKACMRDAAFAIKMPAGDARRVEVPLTFESR